MPQYSSRMYIRVNTADSWEKLKTISTDILEAAWINCTAERLFDITEKELSVWGDWGCPEEELYSLIKAIGKRLKGKGVIIGDTTNINVDPYTYLVYDFGDGVNDCYYTDESGEELSDDEDDAQGYGTMWGFHDNTDLENLAQCINYCRQFGNITYSDKEIQTLKEVGIIEKNNEGKSIFIESPYNIELPRAIDLAGTQYEGRTERIERVKVGDDVHLIREPDNVYDSNAIDVRNGEGSLGHIPADISEKLAPVLDIDSKCYKANVVSVTPLSQRSRRCKSALIAISIEIISD